MNGTADQTTGLLRQYAQRYVAYVLKQWHEAPQHVIIETTLFVVILYILFVKRSYDPKKRGYGARAAAGLTEREKEELIAEWEPEPLVSKPAADVPQVSVVDYVVQSFDSSDKRNLTVRLAHDSGATKLAFTSRDFLGLGSSQKVRDDANRALDKFTLGSCGPRGFYGTTTAHLELESQLAEFMGVPESITYSDELATMTSVIPAFLKRGDVVLVDAGANNGIMTGAKLSRCKVLTFKHNDPSNLAGQLKAQAKEDQLKQDLPMKQRRFIIVEALYANSGHVCRLTEILSLARQYKWRVLLDETLSFGVLGATGRGLLEELGLATLDVDLVVGSLSATLGAVGGFCLGSRDLVDHQRLSGAGYCFSASAPPFLCATACSALQQMRGNKELLASLRKRCEKVHAELRAGIEKLGRGAELVKLLSEASSPVKHIQLSPVLSHSVKDAPSSALTSSPSTAAAAQAVKAAIVERAHEEALLQAAVLAAAERGVVITRSHCRTCDIVPGTPAPTLKFYLTAAHTLEECDKVVSVVLEVLQLAVQGQLLPGSAAAAAHSSEESSNGSANGSSESGSGSGARQRRGKRAD